MQKTPPDMDLFPLVVQYLDIPTIMPHLRMRNLVTADEYLQLSKKWSDGYRQLTAMDLLALLPRKEPTWERALLEAIAASVESESVDVHAGHEYILQVVRTRHEELQQPVQEVCICGCGQEKCQTVSAERIPVTIATGV